MKKIIIILIFYIFSFYQIYSNEIIEESGYNFTIGTIESIEIISIPDNYLENLKYKEKVGNKAYLIKIGNFTLFYHNLNDYYNSKNIYLYVEPSDKSFNIDMYNVGKQIIFRSDSLLYNDDFYAPLYYKSSILDLFYDEKNNYIIYKQGTGYFSCIKNNYFNIDTVSPEDENYLYSSLAFINPTIFKGDKVTIPKLEKQIVIDKIIESGICKDNIIGENINNSSNNIYYILLTIILIIGIIFLGLKSKRSN